MDRQYDMRRPQGSTWSPVTPSTPSFNPTKFTPSTQQNSWKPFQTPVSNSNDQNDVIQGSVQVDPSGGYVHTFGAPKKQSAPQTPVTAPIQNYQNSPYQDSVTVTSTPRYTQQIIIPTNDIGNQFHSPARQTSNQSNSSQFSPVQQSPQRSGQASPSFYHPQNNGLDRVDSNSSTMIIHPARKVSSPYQQPVRQDSYQTNREDSVPYQVQRQDSLPYQPERRSPPPPYQQSPWSPNPPARQESISYQPSRQDSWNQSAQQYSNSPSRQVSSTYSPSRQDSWSNRPVQPNSSNSVFNRQESFSNKPSEVNASSFSPARQDSLSQNLQQPTGLFGSQNTSPTVNQQPVRYEPVNSNSTPGYQRQSSTNYQSLPKPYSPASSSVNQQQPTFSNGTSPYTYGVPGPFVRQQSQQSSGNQPWSPAPVDSFPTPPPFSPSVESSGVPWPASSGLPTPPPPPPPPPQSQQMYPTPSQSQQAAPTPQSQQMPPPPPVAAPPPPPPPPPPPMPSSAGVNQEVPAWKKQIKATKEAKAAAGIPAPTPGTPGPGELPAALAGSMKKDKKPFTYLPGGLDLSEIRSPKMQRRIMANQQQAPPPPSCTGQQVLLQPRTDGASQLPNQFDRLNLGEPHNSERMATAVEPQRRTSTDGQDTRYPGQSRSFRILQMMTGGDDETDSAPPQPATPSSKREQQEEEMRFTGLRRPDNPIPSRAFQALQKMTSANDDVDAKPATDNRYQNEGHPEQPTEEVPVDIRYKGAYIPGRSFKMLQEMTSMNEDGTPMGPPVPSVLQEKRQQRKPPPHLHLNINNQPPPPKQFPQPQVPASQQQTEEIPKMYTGGRIPSQSFRILQAMTGANDGEDGTDM